MARNEEKQQGRLNRLWLQKEREEGRIRDVQEQRPKLSTLTSAASVKKWIPSIKNDIEYYLQQSQLSHYPERKIAEFQQNIEALEKEYKKFITKLRVFDPSCKHKPWTARPYSKRRTETVGSEKPDMAGRIECYLEPVLPVGLTVLVLPEVNAHAAILNSRYCIVCLEVPMVTLHTVKVPCPTTLPPMARSMTNGGHP
ncbi:uncharacterized protein LOC103376744 isoform X2 [Cynoglossus semilaevis]|uniref:uncharacterized protein LOC103376744 isoform X2 n=1 Tax=Cynoglossus semilaevis TaxID=244447 RepID=UPI000496D06B|nr:uncharacterized protein LOC103376744 isoform X2 [Cynoglossus semilaevis]XP_008305460.1 uncharacterized protein LOC103376744 isoform X2 [Cynoglossus semilaevis]XP_016896347.1 uncharacterized protein LOC103376744 isoform X2 [Cynoglossus semilaevis]XP_024908257.1 uncharacterized protein LOC103376744 isoform X2 [Cynoglossus semilaevis]